MVKLVVENGKIETVMRSDDNDSVRLDLEIIEGIASLLSNFEVELLKKGTRDEDVFGSFNEILDQIKENNYTLVKQKLNQETTMCNTEYKPS